MVQYPLQGVSVAVALFPQSVLHVQAGLLLHVRHQLVELAVVRHGRHEARRLGLAAAASAVAGLGG